MSIRNLTRWFHAETGLSPLQWLLQQRVDRARELLESMTLPMDQVAQLSGLGSSESLRQHFVRRVALTPSAYRSSFTHAPEPVLSPGRRRGAGGQLWWILSVASLLGSMMRSISVMRSPITVMAATPIMVVAGRTMRPTAPLTRAG
jgi:hypothetical protein